MSDTSFVKMSIIPKILKLIVITITSLLVILFSASFLLQDKVGDIVLVSINRNLSVKISFGSLRLSFLKRFPNASLELKEVLVHSSNDFDYKSFTGINTDTLLAARNVSVEFRITDILRGKYNIEKISASEGVLNLYSDKGGFVNYNISSSNEKSENDTLSVNLERINLKDIKAYYNNQSVKLTISGVIKAGKIKTKISGRDIDFIADADLEVQRFQLYNTIISKPAATKVDLVLHSSESGFRFNKSTLSIDNNDFEIDGFVSSENVLDLNIKGTRIDILKIIPYLPEKYLKVISEYKPAGSLVADCKIKGPVTRTKNPHVKIDYSLKNGSISHGLSKIPLNNISFSGTITNGLKNNAETGHFSMQNVRLNLGSSEFTGSLLISEFRHPKTAIILKGKVLPQQIKEFFNIESVTSLSGTVDVDLNFTTSFRPKENIKFDDILGLKPRGTLNFNSFAIALPEYKFSVSDVTGNVTLAENIKARDLRFIYKAQPVRVNGEFNNLPEWLSGRNVMMSATADISFRRFIPEVFLSDQLPDGKKTNQTAFTMPGNLSFDVNFIIDSLSYKTFSSSAIKGSVNYKSSLLTFKKLDMNAMNGLISGNGFIVRNANKTVMARGNFNVKGIDVNKAFKTFHNFGQDFIKAENLSGSLSGSLSLLLPMDSVLNPQIKSITAEGKYILSEGALINFEPIKQLSSFIEISELENINFDKLENDFSIRNNFLFIPQMDVKSSAADLSVNGKHSFGNDYEYHVKVLLSEILSKKRKKNRNKISEFGVVEDDGLGRTSLLLIVGNKGDEVEVGYDIKAAGNQVKKNIKTEKQTIKAILNEEYGWYKNDSVPPQKPPEKKQRFKVTWDDSP